MANNLVSIRISQPLRKQAEEIVKQEGYSSVQEFVRESMREAIEKRRVAWTLKELDKLAGSVPNSKPVTKAERETIAKTPIEKDYAMQEFIRECVRKAVAEQNVAPKDIAVLRKLYGSAKKTKRMTKAERDAWYRKEFSR